jgi:hypothetical protein
MPMERRWPEFSLAGTGNRLETSVPETVTESGGLSRRDVLRRSALVGGTMVWMAPAVQTLATPAFADGSPVPGDQCLCTFFLKFDPAESTGNGYINGFTNIEAGPHLPTCDPNGADAAVTPSLSDNGAGGVSIVACGGRIGSATATYNEANGGCVTVTFDGFTVSPGSSYFIVKDGGEKRVGDGTGCEPEDGGVFADVPAAASTFTFCGETTPREALSHLNLAVCVSSFTQP